MLSFIESFQFLSFCIYAFVFDCCRFVRIWERVKNLSDCLTLDRSLLQTFDENYCNAWTIDWRKVFHKEMKQVLEKEKAMSNFSCCYNVFRKLSFVVHVCVIRRVRFRIFLHALISFVLRFTF